LEKALPAGYRATLSSLPYLYLPYFPSLRLPSHLSVSRSSPLSIFVLCITLTNIIVFRYDSLGLYNGIV
jgi:hypothetical protein